MVHIRHLLNLVASLLFVVAILVPSIILLTTPDQEISESEQRTLTQLPENTNPFNQQFSEFTASFEAYTNDQFGYRDRLIYWHNTLKVVYLHKSPTEKVIIGKNKWLFLTGPNQIEDHQGLSILSEDELADWASLFNYRHQWLAERGILYVLVIAPDKKSIYPEYYPPQYPVIYENNTQLDQFLAYMNTHSDLQIIDLREALLAHKSGNDTNQLLYYKVDSHWTQTGALIGYQWMIQQIQLFLPELIPADSAKLRSVPFPQGLQGSLRLMHMMGLQSFLAEEYIELRYVDNLCSFGDYKYAYSANLVTQFDCLDGRLNALIFHDSFGSALRAHWARTFNTTIFFNKGEIPWEITDEFELLLDGIWPAIVIDEMVERNLFVAPPSIE